MQPAPSLTDPIAQLWTHLPFLTTAVSAATALNLARTLLGQVARRQRASIAILPSLLLGLLGALGLMLSYRTVAAQLLPAASKLSVMEPEEPSLVDVLSGVVDQLPPYGVALVTFGVMLVAVSWLGPAMERSRPRPASRPAKDAGYGDALQHLRQLKAELKGRKGEDAVIVVLARLSLPALHDVILGDGRGLTQVDHLVRLPGGIAVLETKTLAGLITGAPRSPEWTQHLHGGRLKSAFHNPLLQNHRHVEAVRLAVAGGVPVQGLVVSAGSARFYPDLATAVIPCERLAAELPRVFPATFDQARLDAAWRELTTAAARTPDLRDAILKQVGA